MALKYFSGEIKYCARVVGKRDVDFIQFCIQTRAFILA